MSYTDGPTAQSTGDRNSTLSPLDIKAVQAIYGLPETAPTWQWDSSTETLTQFGTDEGGLIRGVNANNIIHTKDVTNVIYTGAGNDVVNANNNNDSITTGSGNDIIHAGDGVDRIHAGAGNDTIYVKETDDVIYGEAGNDKIIIDTLEVQTDYSQFAHHIDAGEGFDTVVLKIDYLNEQRILNGVNLTFYNSDNSFKFNFENAERIEFNNGTIALDQTGNAGIAYRMYQAAFDRTPDTAGLGYWIKQLDNGLINLNQMADSFAISNEFQTAYGAPDKVSTTDYVNLLYKNVLKRDADSAGFDYWLQEVSNGFSNSDILASFSESNENIDLVKPSFDTGVWFV
jgi:Ca2+-binding RTX toxin-like protein